MLTPTDEALAFLREQFGEGWRCEVTDLGGGWLPEARARTHGVFVRASGPDPMSAARACVEAWREATGVAPGTWSREEAFRLMDEARAQRDAERAHADRLAEALRVAESNYVDACENEEGEEFVRCSECDATEWGGDKHGIEHASACFLSSLAAHDSLRGSARDARRSTSEREGT